MKRKFLKAALIAVAWAASFGLNGCIVRDDHGDRDHMDHHDHDDHGHGDDHHDDDHH